MTDGRGRVVGMVARANRAYARVEEEEGLLMLESSDCSLPWKLNQQQRTEPLIALTVACVTKGAHETIFSGSGAVFLSDTGRL